MWNLITSNLGLSVTLGVISLAILGLLCLIGWQFTWFGKLGSLIRVLFGHVATIFSLPFKWVWGKLPKRTKSRRSGKVRLLPRLVKSAWAVAAWPFVWTWNKILKRLKRRRRPPMHKRLQKRWDDWREKTMFNPWKMGVVTSAVLTSLLAFLTGFIPIMIVMSVFGWFGLTTFWSWEVLGFSLSLALLAMVLLIFEPDGSKLRYVDVPENHAAIPTLFGRRLWLFFFTEGNQMLPWWLGVWYSSAPVAKTVFYPGNAGERDMEKSMRDLSVDLGHFTPEEARGFVYLNDRLVESHVLVQAKDLSKVACAANLNFHVEAPYWWQQASNPMGTIMGRFAAGQRIAIASNNSEDANQMPSWLPTSLMGYKILVARVAKAKGEYIKGDVVRTEVGNRLFKKGKSVGPKTKQAFLQEVSAQADDDCKPEGGFTESHLDVLDLGVDLKKELARYGGVKDAISIEDITLPEQVEDAGAQLAKERAQRRAELYEADTRVAVTARIAKGIDTPETQLAYEYALVEGKKARLIRGTGDNPVMQAIGALRGDS